MYLLNKKKDLVSFFVEDEQAHFFSIKREKYGYCVEAYQKVDGAQIGAFDDGILNTTFFADALYNFFDECGLKNPQLAVGVETRAEELLLHYNIILSFLGMPFHVSVLNNKNVAFRSIIKPKQAPPEQAPPEQASPEQASPEVRNDLIFKAVNMWKEGVESEKK